MQVLFDFANMWLLLNTSKLVPRAIDVFRFGNWYGRLSKGYLVFWFPLTISLGIIRVTLQNRLSMPKITRV